METIVTNITTRTAAQKGEQPMYIKGMYRYITHTKVNISASMDLMPRFPPTANNPMARTATIPQIMFPLSYPYILPDNSSL